MADLAFSGDSRHLLTSYETPDLPRTSRSRAHQLVAWDVEEGTPTVIEGPGHYWLPNLGSAPTGVTWARGREVFRVDPGTGDKTTSRLPQDVITASWGPDDTSFAYIGRPSTGSRAPWRLYAGRTVAEARGRQVELPSGVDVSQVLGWRDPTHVVVGHFRDTVHVVDVVTGEVEGLDLGGYGEQVNAPQLAGALWRQPLLEPVGPDRTTDPRRPWRWVACAFLVLFGGVLLVLWRRRRGRGLPGPVTTEAPRQAAATYAASAGPRPWSPLARVATGLVLVLADVRVGDVDLLPDPLGWLLAAWALRSLQPAHVGFHVAGVTAWLAALWSLPEWFGAEGVFVTVPIALAQLVVQVAVCTALVAACPRRAPSASTIRWSTLFLSGVLVVALVAAEAEPSTGAVALAIGLADMAVMVWFLVLLYGVAKDAPPVAAPRQRV